LHGNAVGRLWRGLAGALQRSDNLRGQLLRGVGGFVHRRDCALMLAELLIRVSGIAQFDGLAGFDQATLNIANDAGQRRAFQTEAELLPQTGHVQEQAVVAGDHRQAG
jgi:hypothetical protein